MLKELINPLVQATIQEVAAELHQEILEEIQTPKWDWPRETRRKNKTVVGSPRDIVDTEELLNSQDYEVDGTSIKFFNRAPHSDLVHQGGSNGKAELPARPFMGFIRDNPEIVQQKIAQKLAAKMTTDRRGVTRLRDSRGRFVEDRGIDDINTSTELTGFNY